MSEAVTSIEAEEQLRRLRHLTDSITHHTVGINVVVEPNDWPYPFRVTTETDIPVMMNGRNAGKPTGSDFTYDEAQYFLQGLMHGLVFAGGWQE